MSTESKPVIENKEKYTSKIDLHFFRHSIKESDEIGANTQAIRLSSEGRKLAVEKSPKDVNLSQAIAFGSPRVRAQETAGFVMAGSSGDITGDETLDELKAKLNENIKFGSKIGVDRRLDFNDDPKNPVGKVLYEAYARGEYTKAIIEDSDRVALETGDNTGSHYSYKAGQMAKIVKKYLKIAPRWNQLVTDKDKKYKPVLERYLGTHQGMCESFIAKVIEKTEGLESRSAFVSAVGSQGFDYVEGFDIDIETKGAEEPSIKIKFTKDLADGSVYSFERLVPLNLIEDIINEAEQ